MSVTIDLSRDERFDELGLIRLRESYMRPEEKVLRSAWPSLRKPLPAIPSTPSASTTTQAASG